MDEWDAFSSPVSTPAAEPTDWDAFSSPVPKAQPIGKATIYGYQGDAYGDSASLGTGRYSRPTGAWDNPLSETSVAFSPDIERVVTQQGVKPRQPVVVQYADGTSEVRTWDDRTMQDNQARQRFGKPLTGRIDLYSPTGKNPRDGKPVVAIRAPSWDDFSSPVAAKTVADPGANLAATPTSQEVTAPSAASIDAGSGSVTGTASASADALPIEPTDPHSPGAHLVPSLNVPSESGFMASAGAELRKGTYNTAAGVADTIGTAVTQPGRQAFNIQDQPELDAVWQQYQAALPKYNGGGPQYDGREQLRAQLLKRANELSNNPGYFNAGQTLRDKAEQSYEDMGADPRSQNTAAQLGRGVGKAAGILPYLGMGMAGASGQMAGNAYQETYQQALSQGASGEQAQALAEKAGLRTLPETALYLGLGKAASLGAGAAVGQEAGPALKAAAEGTGAFAANVLSGSTIRALNSGNWKDAIPTLETLTVDGLLAAYHVANTPAAKAAVQRVMEVKGVEVPPPAENATTAQQEYGRATDPYDAFSNARLPEPGKDVQPLPNEQPEPQQVPTPTEEPVPAPQPQGATQESPTLHSEFSPENGLNINIRTGEENQGLLSGKVEGNTLILEAALLNPSLRGQGLGTQMYEEALRIAKQRGLQVVSDTIVNEDAARIYRSLAKRGYEVEQNPNVFVTDEGVHASKDGQPVFRVTPKAEAAPPVEVPPPAETPRVEPPQPEQPAQSIRNAQTDIARQAEGFTPRGEPERRTWANTEEEAKSLMQSDPGYADKLVEQLDTGKRQATDTDQFVLARHLETLRKQITNEEDLVNKAFESGNLEERDASADYLKQLRDKAQRVYDVAAKHAGTKVAQSLAARRAGAFSDYSREGIVRQMRASRGGRQLTESEQAEATADFQRIKTAEENLRNLEQSAGKPEEQHAEQVLAEDVAEVTKPAKPQPVKRTKAILDTLSSAAEEARKRIASRRGRLNAGLDPSVLADYAIIGAHHLAKGVAIGADFARKMVDEFGDAIRPHIKAIQEAAVARLRGAGASPEDLRAKLAARVAEGATIGDLGAYMRRFGKAEIANGVRTLPELVAKLHEHATAAGLKLTPEEVRDAYSGYGKTTQPKQDEVSKTARDLRAQAQKVAALEDVLKGQPPKKSGPQRDKPSDTVRRLDKQVKEAMKAAGIEPTDPQTQLASRVQAMETRLTNQLKDLTEEFDLGKKAGTVREPVTSERGEALKAIIDRVKQTLKEVRQIKTLSEDQRADAALRLLDREEAELMRDMQADRFGPKAKREPVNRADVVAKRAKVAALRAEKQELRAIQDAISGKAEADRIAELQADIARKKQQVKEGRFFKEDRPQQLESEKVEDLKKERNALNRFIQGERAKLAEPKRVEAAKERLREIEDQINNGILRKPLKSKYEVSQARQEVLNQIKARQKALNELRRQASYREGHPEYERYVAQEVARLERMRADRQQRIADGDFRRPLKQPERPGNAALQAARVNLERVREEFRQKQAAHEAKNQPLTHRIADGYAKWSRAIVLSGLTTMGKLASSAAEIVAVAPAEEAVGSVYSALLPGIAKRAPRQGGFSGTAEAKAVIGNFRNFWRDFSGKGSGRFGKMDIDYLHGKADHAPREWKEIFGSIHSALKTPARRNEFERSYVKRTAFAAKQGEDVSDPVVQARIGKEAYADAMSAIFMEDSRLANGVKSLLNALDRPGKGGQPASTLSKLAGAIARGEMPVVRIPTNIVARAFEYMLGVPLGAGRAVRAYAKGLDNLSDEQADVILRNLKRGSLGAALLAYGFFNPDNAGGYYQEHDKKKKPGEPGYGELRLFGVNIPKLFVHHPLLESIQVGATMRRVFDKMVSKGGSKMDAATEGLFAASLGLAEETPLLSGITRDVEQAKKGATALGGQMAQNKIPPAVQQAARYLDRTPRGPTALDAVNDVFAPKAKRRYPVHFTDYLKQGIPGLREQVPDHPPRHR